MNIQRSQCGDVALLGLILCAATAVVSSAADRAIDVSYALVPRSTFAPVDSVTALPAPATDFDVGEFCFVEVWCTDLGTLNTGLTSAYVDLNWSAAHASVVSVAHRPPFTLFSSGTALPGLVDELGGSDVSLTGQGIEPIWARLAVVTMSIDALGDIPLNVGPASTSTACLGRGAIATSDINYSGSTLNADEDVAIALRVTTAVEGPDQTPMLPSSVSCVPFGGTYFIELWASDVGSVNTGLTSVYIDLAWNAALSTATGVSHRPPFTLFPSGTVSSGLVDELGGSDALLVGQGVQPVWARVAAVEFVALASGTLTFTATPASTSIAAYGRGVIPAGSVSFDVAALAIATLATATNTGPYCEGETIELSATGGASYAWTGPNGFISNAQNPTIPGATLANAGLYTVVVTDDNGCTGSAETTVVVYANPVATAANTGPYCEGETIELSATGGASYAWTGPNGFTSNAQNPTIPGATLANAGLYTVVVTDDNGCTGSAETTVVVEITPPLPAIVAFPSTAVCASGFVTLSVTGVYESYLWSTGATTPTIIVTVPGVYSVTVSNPSQSPCSADAALTITAGSGARGDSDCDGDVDFFDIDPFVSAFNGEAAWLAGFPVPPACNYYCVNDIDQNGFIDFFDIDPFVACLNGACP